MRQSSPRRTRQRTRELEQQQNHPAVGTPSTKVELAPEIAPISHGPPHTYHQSPGLYYAPIVIPLPEKLSSKQPGLTAATLRTLNSKRHWLLNHKIQLPRHMPPSTEAINATLVFAQEEAGTAICISSNGLLLTCFHCVAETIEELANPKARTKWLLFASGRAVKAECIAWDPRRDLALLKVVAAQPEPGSSVSTNEDNKLSFPWISLARTAPVVGTPLVCIGHPGAEDLESNTPGRKTGYDVLHVSEGEYRGYAEGADPQDNSEIGALMHNCWTYWGHSGAPLVERDTGMLVGLHSSWDKRTGIRRGIGWEALKVSLETWRSLLRLAN